MQESIQQGTHCICPQPSADCGPPASFHLMCEPEGRRQRASHWRSRCIPTWLRQQLHRQQVLWQHGNTKLSLSWNQSLKATSGSEWPMVVKKAKPRDGHTDKSKIIIVILWLEIWIKIMQTFNLLHHSFLYWNQGTHCLHHQLRLDTATIQQCASESPPLWDLRFM